MDLYFECDLSWDDFEGDDSFQRFCPRCEHVIHNVSALTRADAQEFFRAREGQGQVCVTFARRAGKTVFADDPERRLSRQHEGLRKLVLAAALASPLLILGCESESSAPTAVPPVITSNGQLGVAARATASYDPKQAERHAEPCDLEPPAIVRAKRAIEKMFDDLFGAEEKFKQANESVVSGGMMF